MQPGASSVSPTGLWYWSEISHRPGSSRRVWVADSPSSNELPGLHSLRRPTTGSGNTVALPRSSASPGSSLPHGSSAPGSSGGSISACAGIWRSRLHSV